VNLNEINELNEEDLENVTGGRRDPFEPRFNREKVSLHFCRTNHRAIPYRELEEIGEGVWKCRYCKETIRK